MDDDGRLIGSRLSKTRLIAAAGFVVVFLAELASMPCAAQAGRRTAAIALNVHVPARVRMQPGTVFSSSGVTSSVLPLAPNLIEVRISIRGDVTPETLEIPIALSSNLRRFLLRCDSIAGGEGTLTVVANSSTMAGASISSRSRALSECGVLAVFDLPRVAKGPLGTTLQFSIPSASQGETRQIVFQLRAESLNEPVLYN